MKSFFIAVALMFASIATMNAQNGGIVMGTITFEDGSPVIGASVSEVGTTNGTITDINGNYILKVQKEDTAIVIAYIGCVPLQCDIHVPLGAEIVMDFVMKEASEELVEVVVISEPDDD